MNFKTIKFVIVNIMCFVVGFSEKYNLFPGVFLFLGYSNQDEAVLKDHTGLDATNVIDDLRKLVDPLLQYQFVNPAEKDHGLNVFKNLNTVSLI